MGKKARADKKKEARAAKKAAKKAKHASSSSSYESSYSSDSTYVSGDYDDLDDLLDDIEYAIQTSVHDVALEAKWALEDYIYKWYNTYSPKDYNRTYDFVNSADILDETEDGYVVGFDTSRIYRLSRAKNPKWGAHENFKKEDVSDSIPEYLINGSPMVAGGGNRRPFDGLEQLTYDLIRDYGKMMEHELVSNGLEIIGMR